MNLIRFFKFNWKWINIFLSHTDMRANVARTKTMAPPTNISDRHVSHNVYMCACVSARTRTCVHMCVYD